MIAAFAALMGLALLRLSARPRWQRFSLALTEVSRGVPTIAFQFYLVLVLPAGLPADDRELAPILEHVSAGATLLTDPAALVDPRMPFFPATTGECRQRAGMSLP